MSDIEHLGQQRFRSTSLAGLFYPDEDMIIRSAFQSFGLIENPKTNTHCIFAPHGSWYMTGNALALAYKSLIEIDENPEKSKKRQISKVVLLGRRHNSDEDGIYLSESDYFETPVGNLIIDKEINEELMSCNTIFELNDIPHLQEEITETHFPFVKVLFPEASFIPVLIGGYDSKTMSSLASALHIVFEPIIDETLFIISSNSAIHADPEVSKKQSEKFNALIKKKGGTELLRNLHEEHISACGTLAMAAMLESGLLDGCAVTQIPHSDGSLLDIDNKTVYYTSINFSQKAAAADKFVDRRQSDRRKSGN
jgi:AmmeMemoRadiSam system protein B